MRLNFQHTDNTNGKFKVTHLVLDTEFKVFITWEDHTQGIAYRIVTRFELERMANQLRSEGYVEGNPKKAEYIK